MGGPPTKRCPRCGTENPSTMRFCGSCGLDMDAQASAGPPAAASRGFPAWGIVAIVGGVVTVAAVVTILLLTRDSDPVETAAPPPQEQEAGDSRIDELAAYLPPEVVDCQEGGSLRHAVGSFVQESGTAATTGYFASATCDPASGDPVVIKFFLWDGPEIASEQYQGLLIFADQSTDVGDCSIGEEGEMGWSGGGGQGRLACGTNGDGLATLMWTSEAFPVLGTMEATTTDLTLSDIYSVWQGISDYSSA
jgi:zinc-ribbon domain